MREACELKAEHQHSEAQLEGVTRRIMIEGGVYLDRERLIDTKARRDTSAARLKETIESIQETGCLVKDLDIGLIDFPTLFRGQEVYLCWKMGETGIHYWHGTHEGFRFRRPIDREFLDNHRGDRPM